MGLTSENPKVMALLQAAAAIADRPLPPPPTNQAAVAEALRTVGIDPADLVDVDPPNSYELQDWWAAHSAESARRTIPKAIEYGSTDLEWMGQILLAVAGSDSKHPGAAVEMGCAVYTLGKLLRVIAALCDSETPGTDSWFDIEVYATMAQHAREFGSWPAEGMI